MKFTTVAASVVVLSVSSVSASGMPDSSTEAIVAGISKQLTDLMFGAGENICSATAGDIQTVNDTMPLCVAEYGDDVTAAFQAVMVCLPSEAGERRRLADDEPGALMKYVSVLEKGLGLALAGTEFDTQMLKLLRNDMMPALFDEVLNGCVLNATNPIVATIGSMLFKGSAFTDEEYKTYKDLIKGALEQMDQSGGGARRLAEENPLAGLLGECMSGGPDDGPKFAYGSPITLFTFLGEIASEEENPESCAICDMLASVPMATENALDATLINFLIDNRADVTQLMRDLNGLETTMLSLVIKEGSMKSSVCNADKTANLDVIGLGLGSDCLNSMVAYESTAWSIFSDIFINGLPDNCDSFANYLCGDAEPVLPLYTEQTLGKTVHTKFADMFTKLPAETTTMKSYLAEVNELCATDGKGSASSTTLSMMALFSTLAVAAFMK